MSDVPLTGKHSRYDVLDGMRGIAAIMVMLSRLTLEGGEISHLSFPAIISTWLAVDFFFILSGFVIAHSYAKRILDQRMSIREYLWRRVIRLYPMFLLGLLLGVPILLWMTGAGYSTFSVGQIWRGFATNLGFLPYFSPGVIQNIGTTGLSDHMKGLIFPSNPSAWSLFFEMAASIAFVSLLRMKRQTLVKIIVFCFLAMILNGILIVIFNHGYFTSSFEGGWKASNFFGGFPRVFFGFSFGMLVYQLIQDDSFGARLTAWSKKYIRNSYVLYLLLIAVLFFPKSLKGLYPMFILTIVAPYFVFVGSKLSCTNPLELKVAKFLGWLSYPIYCLHYPIQRAVYFIGKQHDVPFDVIVISATVLTFVLCIVLTKLVEEPVRRFLTRKIIGMPEADLAPGAV